MNSSKKKNNLQDVLMEEVAKMELKKKCQIKTAYSNGDFNEEYDLNKSEYRNLDAPYKKL